jgi:hypothetical protein
MNLLSLKLKEKDYIFKAFENDKSENAAKIIFKRFPLPDESFPYANQKSILDSNIVKDFNNTAKEKEELVGHIISTMIDNITAQRVNYKKFFEDCVSSIENLEYNGKEIKTTDEFFEALPSEASFKIAHEVYLYSKTDDKFTIEEKKI